MKRLCKVNLRYAFILILISLLLKLSLSCQAMGATDISITNFYPCDALGIPQDSFPKKTTSYFNISVKNVGQAPRSISIHLTVQDEVDAPVGADQFDTTIYPNVSMYHIMSIVIPKCVFVGLATAYASVFADGIAVGSASTRFRIEPEDLTSPVIRILSPQNSTYSTPSVPLVFTVNKRTTWLGYRLGGPKNVTIPGNATLTGLVYGSYHVTVYANDTSGNMGRAESYFTVLIMHDVAVIELKCSSVRVYKEQTVNINVLVQNQGTAPETFNVTTYGNTSAIKTLTITNLAPSNQTTLVFTWNTSSFSYGNYTITAVANTVSGEVDTADNRYTGDFVRVCIPGDITGNGLVDSEDLGIFANAWGASKGEPSYVPEADINSDGTVDSADLGTMMAHWGESE